MAESIFIRSGGGTLALSAASGAVTSLNYGDGERLAPSAELFSLRLLTRGGDPVDVVSGDFPEFRYDGKTLTYWGHPKLKKLKVTAKWRGSGGFFFCRFSVENVPGELVLEWLDGPQPTLGDGKIFWPFCEGVEISDPTVRERNAYGKYHVLGYPVRGRSFGCFYPGEAQMQFLAGYRDGRGVYFAAHDPQNGTKAVEFAPAGDGLTRFSLQTFTGCHFGESYETPFEYVLGGFSGSWFEACEIYRGWVDSLKLPAPEQPLPGWFDDSPVVLIYPVRGTGDDSGTLEPNEFYPYSAALPAIRRLAGAFDSRVMALLMHWEGTAPWAPPYVWPPYGGEALLGEFRDRLHAEGHLLGVYCSGTAWTQKSSITDYSREEQCEREGLVRHMMRGPKGEIDAVICNGENSQRLGYDLCLTESWSRDTVKAEILKLARFGIDYAQFFDQNLGGQSNFCYSHSHAHAPVPGPWQVAAMHRLLAEVSAEAAACGSDMVLGCEAAAAQPYLDMLQFSDARSVFAYSYGRPVPGYAAVFHERVNSFMGNQCGIGFHLDLLNSPGNLLYRTAYAFNAGDLLSVVLKDGGHIHWGWVVKWEFPEPDQENIATLIRNLNAVRRAHPRFLRSGRMLRPRFTVAAEPFRLIFFNRVETVESVLHSRWRAPEGDELELVTNFLPQEQRIRLTSPDGAVSELTLPPLSATVLK